MDDLSEQIRQELLLLADQLKNPQSRFRIYESLLQDKWSDELAYKAFEEIKLIDNADDKIFDLQSLSSSVRFHAPANDLSGIGENIQPQDAPTVGDALETQDHSLAELGNETETAADE